MSLGDEVARGGLPAAKESDIAAWGVMSAGLASVVLATTASAQETAKEEAQQLPPLEVTAKKTQGKKAVAKKAAPAASPAPLPPQDVDQEPQEPAFGDGTALTPSTGNTLQSGTGIGRLPGSLQDTPQTVNVISQRQLQEQGTSTLDQALRNVPGVTVNIGEGGGGMNGDQFRIRGFQAKGDIYVDGLRDFGVYVRDSFAYEQVEVIKGPSSESFGMGTTGGAINIQQKTAHRGDSAYAEGSIGTDDYYRAMLDVNQQINATTAMRAVGMWHDQDIADRDHLYSERWGFLGSLAFGLGTDTKLTLNYLHQSGERLPDFGVPIFDPDTRSVAGVNVTGPALGRPVTEFGVDRSNYYGKATDKDESQVDMVTARYSSKLNDWLTLYNDTRVAWYSRDFAQTVPNCALADDNPATHTCGDSILDGTFSATHGLGGPAGFDQESWGAQNVTTAVARFKTAGLKHELVAGLDVFYQDDNRTQKRIVGAKVPGTIGNPDFSAVGYEVLSNPLALKAAEADNVGLFASDRIWLTQQFSVLGGVRWDRYSASYRATDTQTGLWTGSSPANPPAFQNPTQAEDVDTVSEFASPKLALMWEPTQNQTYYASWAKSYSPVGQFITNDNASVPTTPGQSAADPEENELWELGAKVSTPDGRLGFTAALFRVEKGNATYTDPTSGDTVLSGEIQRVQGIELGVTGSVTDAWTVQAAYAYFDSEILFNPAAPGSNPPVPENGNKGNAVPFVPEHSVALWTTYDVATFLPIDGRLLVGGGVVYQDGYFVNSANSAEIPSKFTLDALISYEVDDWKFALNGYNLTDELNYDAGFGNRAVVGAGRSAIFTVGKKF